MARTLLLPRPKDTSERRIRLAFGDHGYTIFTLRRNLGDGFVAIRGIDNHVSAVIVRRRHKGMFELQWLDAYSSTTRATLEAICRFSGGAACIHPFPYNPAPNRKTYEWHDLVRIRELREAATALRVELRDDIDAKWRRRRKNKTADH